MMAPDQMNESQHNLLMDVKRSIRYHDRRRAFFDLMHRVTSVLTILLAGSVLFDIAKPGPTAGWLTFISVTGALLAACDMVVGYASHADLHRSLKVRFVGLESKIISGGDTPEEWSDYNVTRLEIESDEPPVYRALDTLCHNELAASLGHKDLYPITFIQKATCHLFHWPNIASS